MKDENDNDIDVGTFSSIGLAYLRNNESLNAVFGNSAGKGTVYEKVDNSGLIWRLLGTMKDEKSNDIDVGDVSSIDFGNLGNNGKLYSFVGSHEGDVQIYEKLDNTGLNWKYVGLMKDEKGGIIDVGRNSSVSFVKSDSGELLGLAIGSGINGLYFYGISYKTTAVEGEKDSKPSPIQLYQNRPNPFNHSTTIDYTIPENTNVRLEVYDITGRRIKVLENTNKTAGTHTAVWNGRDEQERIAGNGAYIYRIQAGNFVKTGKMLMLK